MAGQALRSFWKRPTNSAAICWLSAADPPLPQKNILCPLDIALIITSAAPLICERFFFKVSCLTVIDSAKICSIIFFILLLGRKYIGDFNQVHVHQFALGDSFFHVHKTDLVFPQ